jgi:hypothetical protein
MQCLWKCYGRQKLRWPPGEKCDGFRNEKIELRDLCSSDRSVTVDSPEMFWHADVIVRDGLCITTWQAALSLSISKGSVNHFTRDLGYWKVCAWWVPRSFAVEHATERKGFFLEFLARFEAEGESLLSRIVIAAGSIILNRKQNGNSWKSTVFSFLGEKIKNISISMQGHDHSLLGLWRNGSYGCDADIRTHTELGSVSNDFGLARIQGKSCFSKAAHKFWGRLGRSSQNLFGQCTLQPRSTAVLFQLIWSPEGCNSQYEVWNWWVCDECSDKLATWAGQGRAQNRQGLYTPAPCWERLCEKIGYGLKPTLFIMCNFRNLRINIYWKKIKALLSVHPS